MKISNLAGSLAGKKTYIAAVLTALGGILGYLTGDVNIGQLISVLGTAATAAGLKHGQANS